MKCECDAPGFCYTLNRAMTGRVFDICQGKVLTPEKCDEYRRLWAAEASGDIQVAGSVTATAEQFPCIYRESLLEVVPCQVCGQKNLTAKLYGCSLHEKCTVGQHGVTHDGSNATSRVKVCLSCDDRNEVG